MPAPKRFDEQKVLEKAMFAFWEHGYEATSLQMLVERMGINRGSLYSTYGDKHQLFLAALEYYSQHFRNGPMHQVEQRFPPRRAIEVWLTMALDLALKNPRGCMVANTAVECIPHDDQVGQFIHRAQQQMGEFFQRMVAAGQAEGSIRNDINAADLASSLLASLLGMFVLARGRPGEKCLRAVVDRALSQLD